MRTRNLTPDRLTELLRPYDIYEPARDPYAPVCVDCGYPVDVPGSRCDSCNHEIGGQG